MSKDLKVLWTENAIQDLLGIKAYIAQDSIDRAEEWVFELYTAGESLSRLQPPRENAQKYRPEC